MTLEPNAYARLVMAALPAAPSRPPPPRPCLRCLQTLPADAFGWGPVRRRRICRACAARDRAEPAARQAARRYAKAAAAKAQRTDPVRGAALRARQAATARRYRQRVAADPARTAAALERERIAYRLRRERAGVPLERIRALPATMSPTAKTRRLPAAPLVAVILAQREPHESTDALAARCGTVSRRVREWRKPGAEVQAAVAEVVLHAIGVTWEDCWAPGTAAHDDARAIFDDDEAV